MMSALLQDHLRQVQVPCAVASAGTTAEALAPIPGVSEQMYRLGVALPPYVGRQVDADSVRSADLIVTAEPHHVVWIAGRWPEAFSKTYTLPELVTYGEDVGSRGNETLSTWLTRAANVRPPTRAYLEPNTVAAVADPTGAPEEKWIRVADQIDDLCGRLALLLA